MLYELVTSYDMVSNGILDHVKLYEIFALYEMMYASVYVPITMMVYLMLF